MNHPLPAHVRDWASIQPFFQDLIARPLTAETILDWLKDWSDLRSLVFETYNRLYTASTCDTKNPEIQNRYEYFLDEVFPDAQAADQQLKEKLVESGLEAPDFATPLRHLQAEISVYHPENLPLLSEEIKLTLEFAHLLSTQSVTWDGKEVTQLELRATYLEADRARREAAWRLSTQRQLADRDKLDKLWSHFFCLRNQIAANTGVENYREYLWRKMLRFDYSPEDCHCFHQAIEQVAVPAAARMYAHRQKQLGVDRLRPWDLEVDPLGRSPLKPFATTRELEDKCGQIFAQVDPQLHAYYQTMRQENLLDLENRIGKAPYAYSIDFPLVRRPFIFMNTVGTHDDLLTFLHECGHAFHTFEAAALPYHHQHVIGLEIAEVASMGMELLSSPYWGEEHGGFYTPGDYRRARREHLEAILRFWPYMAVVDAFQLWAYEEPQAGADPRRCDEKWTELWQRFMHGVDWTGLGEERCTGWQRRPHIFENPFYYIEYGIAQLGAIQIYRNALEDQASAVAAYRRCLALGGTRPLPELFAAAGARFAFDADALKEAVDLIEGQLAELSEA